MAWQMYELTDSPWDVGLIGLARAVPLMAALPLGGLLADRGDRRRVLIAAQFAQAAVTLFLTGASFANLASPLLLYFVAAALALCAAVDAPARQSIVPLLVPASDLPNAFAVMNLQQKVGTVVGPALAGLAISAQGPWLCYAVDTGSWLAMLLALASIRERRMLAAQGARVSLRSIREGFAFVRRQHAVLSVLVLDFGVTLLGTNRALLPVYARDILNVGAPGLGLMFAAMSVGAVVSGLLLATLPPVRRMGAWVLFGVSIYSLCTVIFAVSQSFPLTLVMLAGVGGGNALSVILRGAMTQVATPDRLRGRVASVTSIFTTGGPQLGQAQSGLVAELLGAPNAALLGAVATLLVTARIATIPAVRLFDARYATNETRVSPITTEDV